MKSEIACHSNVPTKGQRAGLLSISAPGFRQSQRSNKQSIAQKLSYTIAEAATVTGLSRTTLWRQVKAGKLDVSKIGGRILILAGSLQAMLERGRQEFVSSR